MKYKEGLSDFSKFSDLLCAELSKIEYEYSEVLYRMKYIDEQLISIGKKESLQKIMHDLYKNVNLTKKEKIFISIAYKENLEILLHALALCENPIEVIRRMLVHKIHSNGYGYNDQILFIVSDNKRFFLCTCCDNSVSEKINIWSSDEVMEWAIDRCNENYYGIELLSIDLYEKVLNKRIELENLKSQYNRKMKLFYL